MAHKETRVVDNRTFLLGLDELYREAMKRQERGELIRHARDLAKRLRVTKVQVPIEGYYSEDATLTEYFLLMRSLQQVSKDHAQEVSATAAYRRLYAVTSSTLFGESHTTTTLLPAGIDALTRALNTTKTWMVAHLTDAAHRDATGCDGYALVTLAAWARDPVVLTALRESVVLYARAGFLGRQEEPKYEWHVDAELADRAARFVATFNALFPVERPLPAPIPENAKLFWYSRPEGRIVGRSVRLGSDADGRFYHWALRIGRDAQSLASMSSGPTRSGRRSATRSRTVFSGRTRSSSPSR